MGTTIGAVILGAGFARRFGSDKRLHAFGEATIAETTVHKYCEAFASVRLVVREEDAALAELMHAFPVELCPAADARLGMGHSLAAGFADLTWDWAFVGLLDMPQVQTRTLCTLRDTARRINDPAQLIVRPRTGGDPPRYGHPIGIARALFDEVRQSTGDAGARRLVAAHADAAVEVVVDDPGIYRDIDTPADLA